MLARVFGEFWPWQEVANSWQGPPNSWQGVVNSWQGPPETWQAVAGGDRQESALWRLASVALGNPN